MKASSQSTVSRDDPKRTARPIGYRALLFIGSLAVFVVLNVACGSETTSHEGNDHATSDLGGDDTDLVVVKSREKGGAIAEALAERILSVEHVVGVEKYIRLRMADFDVIGVEPGAPMRIMTGQPDVHLTEAQVAGGKKLVLADAESQVVLTGELFAHSIGTSPGSKFDLPGSGYNLTVAGEFSTAPNLLSNTILMPLALAQEIYDKPDAVTHFWVSVDSAENTHRVIQDLQLKLGEAFDVLPRTYE